MRQLEYTWLRTIAGVHADFWQVTQEALDWTLEREGLDDRPEIRDRLLDLYWTLDAYVEVPAALAHLQEEGHALAILSNGSEKMLAAAVEAAGIGDLLEATLSVDQVGVFKPDARVYAMVGAHFGIVPAAVAFVSSNGWDAAAAAGYGFRSIWVNARGDARRASALAPGVHGGGSLAGAGCGAGMESDTMNNSNSELPGFADILAAAQRLAPVAARTPILESKRLNETVGRRVLVKAESLQHGGAFKFRGAWNHLRALRDELDGRSVLAVSSGNHGAGFARAAGLLGLQAAVVMPHDGAGAQGPRGGCLWCGDHRP